MMSLRLQKREHFSQIHFPVRNSKRQISIGLWTPGQCPLLGQCFHAQNRKYTRQYEELGSLSHVRARLV